MRRVFRIIALICLALALMALGGEIVKSLEAKAWQPLALGQIWYMAHSDSLNLVQAVVQRYLWPPLWDPVAIEFLRWPASAIFAGLFVFFELIARLFRRREGGGSGLRRLG